MSNKISSQRQQKIRERANYLCEYCHTSEKWQYVTFTIDHVVPQTDGGNNSDENLALACFHCNRRKSNHQIALDPDTNENVSLFNPRKDEWSTHFIWSADGTQLIGRTVTGRATVHLLNMNRERIMRIRAADIIVNRHPPDGDPSVS